MSIQWFPGHMTRTKKLILENLKKVDMIIEVLDARAPLASRNPLLETLTKGKPRLILLNKADLADASMTEKWIRKLSQGDIVKAVKVNSKNVRSLKSISQECKYLCRGKKWVNRRPVVTMIVGIPNVGKSTVINTLAGKKKAAAANKPGVTQNMQRVPVSRDLLILDTPGILWHKFDDQLVGMKLAILGSIKDAILNLDQIALGALGYISKIYPQSFIDRYKLTAGGKEPILCEEISRLEAHILLEMIAKSRGLLLSGGGYDLERASRLFLKEFRDGILGRISLEEPDDPSKGWETIREEL